jgi:hypothetical protein
VAVSKNWLDVLFVLARRLKHRRIEKTEDLDADLAGWLQEAHDHRKQKDEMKETT